MRDWQISSKGDEGNPASAPTPLSSPSNQCNQLPLAPLPPQCTRWPSRVLVVHLPASGLVPAHNYRSIALPLMAIIVGPRDPRNPRAHFDGLMTS